MPEIYHTNLPDTARYVLGQYEGNRPLIVISLNPSKATPQKLDITLSKVKGFARNLGFGGFIMLNIYPQRSTDPDGLHKRRNPQLVNKNLQHIKSCIHSINQPVIWASWGNLIHKRPYLRECLSQIVQEISTANPEWIHIGSLTKAGNPRHPSRMGYAQPANSFDIHTYLRNIL